MRRKERIQEILDAIKYNWDNHPDQRFYQLLTNMNIYQPYVDMYHVEDDELIENLKEI